MSEPFIDRATTSIIVREIWPVNRCPRCQPRSPSESRSCFDGFGSSTPFGTRWASRVKPATLQLLMRHKSIETTLKYYVDQDADDVADELWKAHSGPGNTLDNTPSPEPKKTEKGSIEESIEPFAE